MHSLNSSTDPDPNTRCDSLRGHARSIWEAAIRAVDPRHLVVTRLTVDERNCLVVANPDSTRPNASSDQTSLEPPIQLNDVRRILVVGGGKAAAGLAAGLESVLGTSRLRRHEVSGLVSVPKGCQTRLERIEIRETRPAGENLPTPAVVQATAEMLAALRALGGDDLAIVLLSGGGSALVAAPRPDLTLDEKIARTRLLAGAGATIAELNAERSRMSLVKAGGMANATTAGRLLVIVLSDVVGDDLRVIASGPCMPPDGSIQPAWTTCRGCSVSHCLVGCNDGAVAAAESAARAIGYDVTSRKADPRRSHETADDVGRRLAGEAIALAIAARAAGRPMAVVEGGEAVVRLPDDHGKGGRNQQTVLAAAEHVLSIGDWPPGLLIASIGTDGEDGPTDAAGGLVDANVVEAFLNDNAASESDAGSREGGAPVPRARLTENLVSARLRCDAYPLLDRSHGLVRTGPSGTNVADLRILLARP